MMWDSWKRRNIYKYITLVNVIEMNLGVSCDQGLIVSTGRQKAIVYESMNRLKQLRNRYSDYSGEQLV